MPTATFTVPSILLARPGVPVGIFRYAPKVGYQPLDCVKCLEISYREGPTPSKAVFEYISGNYGQTMVPIGFEKVLPLRRVGDPRVLNTDDEIVVVMLTPQNRLRFLFHGYVQVPETSFTDRSQSVVFQSQGIEARAWDSPMSVSTWRDGDDPTNPTKNRVTGIPLVFNPTINHVITGNQVAEGQGWEAVSPKGNKYSVFIDPYIQKTVEVNGAFVDTYQKWNLFSVINYIFCEFNQNQTYVRVWEPDKLKTLLSVMTPKDGQHFRADKPDTYTLDPINIPETDLTDQRWPDAANTLLAANGYATCFRLTDDGKDPITFFDIYKLNESSDILHRDLYMQDWMEDLEPGLTNLGGARLSGDLSDIVNAVSVATAPTRYEASLILAPLFQTGANDTTTDKEKYNSSHPDFKDNRDPYRIFGIDETGEGHLKPTFSGPGAGGVYTFTTLQWVTTVLDLTPILGTDAAGNPAFVVRRRPGLADLWTKDKTGEMLRPELYISVDYNGPVPAIWDGKSGTWIKVKGGWKLMEDRLGIRITWQKPNAWHIGKPAKGTSVPEQIAGGDVRLIDWLASPNAADRKAFTLMLVCTFEGDQYLQVLAPRRAVSPTKFTILDTVDMRSKLRPGFIHPSSWYHPQKGQADAKPSPVGNELDDALDYAIGKREARQLGSYAGQIDIPRLVTAYAIGNRIRKIHGRDTSLQMNADANGLESPAYPRVIGMTWKFDKKVTTHLILSDRRSDYAH